MEAKESHSQRIDKILEQALHHSVVLLEAAPGYGKSELMERFLDREAKNYAWLGLRRMDNHLFFNWKQLINALSSILPDQASKLFKLETPETLGQIAELIELIDSSSSENERGILVIDDYSILEDEKARFLYENLVESNFSNLCIVIISNQKSEIQDICMRSNTDCYYIKEEILRFTDEETYSLFEKKGILLSYEQAAKVSEKWEGWPLPLLMLAKECQTSEEVTQKSSDVLLQLFHSQFYQGYSVSQKKCLIQLSLLEVIPPELFELFSEEERLFLKRHSFLHYDLKNDLYSFQEAYGAFLKAHQTILLEEEKQYFYQRAAEVFLARKKFEEALPLFSYSHNYDQVAALIWKLLTPFTDFSQAKFLYNYSEMIPKDYLTQHPRAELQKVSLLFFIGRIEESEKILRAAIERLELEDSADKAVLGDAYHLLAQIDRLNADEIFLEHTRIASDFLAAGTRYWNEQVPILLKAPWTRFPRYEEGVPDQIAHSKKVFEELNPYITTILGGLDLHVDIFCAAEIAYHQYDLKKARILLLEILYSAESDHLYESIFLLRHFLMRIALLRGNISEAEQELKKVAQLIQEHDLYQYNGVHARMASWFALYHHNPDKVPTRVIKNDIKKGAKWELARNGFPQAKYLIQKNRYEEALALSNYLAGYYSKHEGLWMDAMYAKTFRAVTYLKMGEHDLAIKDLEAVYHMTHGNRIITPLIEWEEEMRHLMHVARKKAPEKFDPEWCDLICAKSTTLAKRVSKICKQQLAEKRTFKLTPRRLEILNDLAKGLTSEEIAKEKEISVNTVHSHIKNIYSDLGAVNRADAIRIATQNHLI